MFGVIRCDLFYRFMVLLIYCALVLFVEGLRVCLCLCLCGVCVFGLIVMIWMLDALAGWF